MIPTKSFEIAYPYDKDGLRTSKTVDGVKTVYSYQGSLLIAETRTGIRLYFSYDSTGKALSVNYNGTEYYYLRNGQGDIVGLLDGTRTRVVSYRYDSWGKPVSVEGTLAGTLGEENPFRYKGYYYDNETGLYYLQSRYYDPEVGRFISADGYVSTGLGILGYNMYVYCVSNPVNLFDPTGCRAVNTSVITAIAFDGGGSVVKKAWYSGIVDTYHKVKGYITNDSEQVVLDAKYFAFYKGKLVIRTNGDRSGSFGIIFLTKETNQRTNPEDMLRHEYGHTKQLDMLGPVGFLLCIGLPSYFEWGSEQDYYERYWEITADVFGGVVSRVHSDDKINAGLGYLAASKLINIISWTFIR